MDLSLQQKVSMTELINSNGWKVLSDKLKKQRDFYNDRVLETRCVDMADYIASTRILRFIDLVIETPMVFVAQEDLKKELEQEEEYDGA